MNNSITRNTPQACAACKYQRRKCGPNCILAPYFPHDRQKQFINAHKLFGVGKINNLIKHLSPEQRDIAMSTIIYESDMRANDRVGGCYAIIQNLHSQIEYNMAELQVILNYLALYRAQAQNHQHYAQEQHVQHGFFDPNTKYSSVTDEIINAMDPLTLNNTVNADDTVAVTSPYHYLQQMTQPEQFMLPPQETSNINDSALNEDVNAWAMQDSISLSPLSLQMNNDNGKEGDQKPIFDLIKEIK